MFLVLEHIFHEHYNTTKQQNVLKFKSYGTPIKRAQQNSLVLMHRMLLNERLLALLHRPSSEHTGAFPVPTVVRIHAMDKHLLYYGYLHIKSTRKWNERLHSCYFHYNFIIANTNPELTGVF